MSKLQARWPGLAVKHDGGRARMVIPAQFHIGHEEHFAQVARRFFDYAEHPAALPAWERAYMLAIVLHHHRGCPLAFAAAAQYPTYYNIPRPQKWADVFRE